MGGGGQKKRESDIILLRDYSLHGSLNFIPTPFLSAKVRSNTFLSIKARSYRLGSASRSVSPSCVFGDDDDDDDDDEKCPVVLFCLLFRWRFAGSVRRAASPATLAALLLFRLHGGHLFAVQLLLAQARRLGSAPQLLLLLWHKNKETKQRETGTPSIKADRRIDCAIGTDGGGARRRRRRLRRAKFTSGKPINSSLS